MKRNFLSVLLLAITLLTSCHKDIEKKTVVASVPSVDTERFPSSSTVDGAVVLLSRNTSFGDTTYSVGTNQKIGQYTVSNGSQNTIRVQTIEVSIFSTSSTVTIPAQAITNLSLRNNGTQIGSVVGQPLTNGKPNIFAVSLDVQSQNRTAIMLLSDLQSPPFSFFTTMKITGIDLVTGKSFSSTVVNGQAITTVVESAILPTFVPSLSTASQYVACGDMGNQYETNATFHFPGTVSGYRIIELNFSVVQHNGGAAAIKIGSVSAPFVANNAYLTGLDIVVPGGSSGINMETKLWYPGVGIAGLPSGTESTISLVSVKYINLVTSVVTTASFNVPAVPMMLVGSKPTVTISAPIGSPILVSGQYVEAISVAVSADPRGDIEINTIPFNLATDNVTLKTGGGNPFIVKDQFQVPLCGLGFSPSPTGGDCGWGFAFCGGVGHLIPAGTTKIFHIFVPVDVVGSGVARLYTKLRSSDGFNWEDVVGEHTVFWNQNITYLKNYPISTISVVTN